MGLEYIDIRRFNEYNMNYYENKSLTTILFYYVNYGKREKTTRAKNLLGILA